MDQNESNEKLSPRSSTSAPPVRMTLERAIELGEYHPEFLAQFPDWHTFTKHVQFEYVRKALDNRRKQLLTQWAEISNILDFRLKPHLNEALKNVEHQLNILKEDKEKFYVFFSEQ